MAPTLEEQRDRSRGLATSIVAFAIMAIGLAFLIMAVLLPLRGGLGLLFVGIVLGGLGAAALLGGFFFHLVPSRLEALEEEKRAYDARVREEERERQKRLGKM